MNKKKMFRRLVAISASVTMIAAAAVSASASNFSTRTLYKTGSEDVEVRTTVTDLAIGDEVTYMATRTADGSVVYIDQYTAKAAGTNTFKYVTSDDDINSAVKMAKNNSGFTSGEAVSEASGDSGTIPDASKLAITLDFDNDVADQIVYKNPLELAALGTGSLVLSVNFVPLAGYTISSVEYNSSEVANLSVGTETISFDNPIELVVNPDGSFTPAAATFNITLEEVNFVAPAFVGGFKDLDWNPATYGGSDVGDEDEEEVRGRAFSILADTSLCPVGDYYVGIAISTVGYVKTADPADVEHLRAINVGGDKKFGITVVDKDADDDTVYYFVTYIEKPDGTYVYGDHQGMVSLVDALAGIASFNTFGSLVSDGDAESVLPVVDNTEVIDDTGIDSSAVNPADDIVLPEGDASGSGSEVIADSGNLDF